MLETHWAYLGAIVKRSQNIQCKRLVMLWLKCTPMQHAQVYNFEACWHVLVQQRFGNKQDGIFQNISLNFFMFQSVNLHCCLSSRLGQFLLILLVPIDLQKNINNIKILTQRGEKNVRKSRTETQKRCVDKTNLLLLGG